MDFSSPLDNSTAARPLVVADDGEQPAKKKQWSWLFKGAVKSTPAMMPSSCTNRDSYNTPPPSLLDDALPQEIIFFNQRAPPPEAPANPNDDDQQEERGNIHRSPSLLLACRGPEQLLGSFLGPWGQHHVNEPTDDLDVLETVDIESFVFALRNFRQKNNTTTTTSLRKQQILATISILLVVVVAAYYLSVAATSPDDAGGGSPRHHSWFRFP